MLKGVGAEYAETDDRSSAPGRISAGTTVRWDALWALRRYLSRLVNRGRGQRYQSGSDEQWKQFSRFATGITTAA